MSYNKTILITGSSAGIGKATVETFAKEGANVTATDINEKKLSRKVFSN